MSITGQNKIMNIKLPLIGNIRTGKDADSVVEVVKEVQAKKKGVLGTFLDFSNSGELVDEVSASSKLINANVGWVYRNNDVIAKEVATIKFELYKIKTVRDEVVYDRIYTHEILSALSRFNEFTTSYDAIYTTQSHRKLAGDSFWYIERSGTKINNIFILPPDKVKIDLGDANGSQRVIKGYEYTDTVKGKQIKITYAPEDIIHFKVPDPKNPYRGKSTVVAAAEAIDIDNMASYANKKLFERGLISELMLTTEKSLTPEQIKQLHSEFRNTYGGVKNAYKVPIFSGGIEPKNVQMSNKDAQFLEQQQWLRDKICSLFGNPKSIITTDDVNRANADATILNWKRGTITSEMKSICDTLNEFLVPLYGENLLLGFCDPVEEDEDAKIEQVTQLVDKDIISINEAREELGYQAVDGGDELGFQRSERRFNAIPDAVRRVNHQFITSKFYGEAEAYKELKAEATKYAKEIVKSKKQLPKPTVKEKRLTTEKALLFLEKQLRIVDAVEPVFYDRVLGFIDQMVDKALEAVPNEVTDMQKAKSLLDEDEWTKRAVSEFLPILMQAATQAGNEAQELIAKTTKAYVPTKIKGKIEKRVRKFSKSMVETDIDKMTNIIIAGVASRTSIPEIRSNIEETFKGAYDKVQAQVITRTEVISAANQASLDVYKQSDEVEAKQWLTAPDADEDCAQYEGEITTLGGNFYETSEFADGDPPLHPNCRCVLLPVLKGELAIGAEVKLKVLEDKLKTLEPKLEKYQVDIEKGVNEKLELKEKLASDKLYIKALEEHLGLEDE